VPTLTATHPDDLTAPSWARGVLTDALRHAGIVEDTSFHGALLVVSELVTNVVVHAGSDIELRMVIYEHGLLRLEVGDHDPRRPLRRLHRAPESIDGMGLNIVHHVVLDWGVERRTDWRPGKVVWAELPITIIN